MVVFYLDIVDRILAGGDCTYTQNQLGKLDDWTENDKRSELVKNRERRLK